MSSSEQIPKNFFRSTRYILFWISSLFSNIGTWMQQVAQPWVVLNLSNSAFWVGLDGFALNAPGWLFTLLGGVLADRLERRRTVMFFQFIQFLCVLTMVVLLALGWLKVWMIVIISFLVGLTDALSVPSLQSIIPSLVERRDIHRAVSLSSIQFNLSRILGPAIAGVVIVRFGAIACFSSNAASYIPFFISLYLICPRGGLKIQKGPIESTSVQQLKELRNIIFQRRVGLPLMTTLVNNLFCGPLIAFCAVIIKNSFHGQAGSYGEAMASFGIGGLIGASSTLYSLPPYFSRNRFSSAIAVLLGFVVVAIGLNQSYFLLLLLLLFAGATLTASNISANTFLQENAENSFRGRIISLYQLALSGGLSLGALLTGLAVTQLNISSALLINGIMAIASQVFIFWQQFKIPVSLSATK